MNELIEIGIGAFMPILISTLKHERMPDWLKVLISLTACIAVGALKTLAAMYLAKQEITLDSFVASIGIIMTTATIVYKAYFEKTKLNATLEEKQVL